MEEIRVTRLEEMRLTRIEGKLDKVAEDVMEVKITLAELTGARKVLYAMAAVIGAAAGILSNIIVLGIRHP